MIEVAAKLIGGPVYLPGDSIGCCITFINKCLLPSHAAANSDPPDHTQTCNNHSPKLLKHSSSSNRRPRNEEILAWSSVQIHCSCVTSDRIAILPATKSGTAAREDQRKEFLGITNETSLVPYKGDNGSIVFSTSPKILFCDLKLQPGESKSFLYTETLQNEIPPSFRGQLVKYSYKVTIATQRVNSPIKLMKIPLRILVIDGLPEIATCEDSIDLSPSNPFLDTYEKDKELEPALQLLQNITARRSCNFYNITNSRGKVATFSLFKIAYKLGEDVIGTFDFTNSTVSCLQFTVTLQCEEIISEKYRAAAATTTPPPLPNKRDRAITSYSNFSEFCLSMKLCFLNLPIPLHITPAFSTNIVSLKWKLHFEFVTSVKNLDEQNNFTSNIHQPPKAVDIETMIWDLPIQIYPTVTISDLHMQTKSYLLI